MLSWKYTKVCIVNWVSIPLWSFESPVAYCYLMLDSDVVVQILQRLVSWWWTPCGRSNPLSPTVVWCSVPLWSFNFSNVRTFLLRSCKLRCGHLNPVTPVVIWCWAPIRSVKSHNACCYLMLGANDNVTIGFVKLLTCACFYRHNHIICKILFTMSRVDSKAQCMHIGHVCHRLNELHWSAVRPHNPATPAGGGGGCTFLGQINAAA